jgi:RNA polymerase sigma-70 factor (ECF subfamily)
MLRGEPETVGEALVAEYGSLVTYSRRLTANGPEANDLVQMLCARVLANSPSMRRPDNLSAWLRTVLFRLFIDFRRRARWEVPIDGATLDRSPHAAEPEGPLPPVTVDDVRAVLSAIPPHYRVPYELYTFENITYEGIATRLGVPCKTVATRISRARKRLRGLLEEKHRI